MTLRPRRARTFARLCAAIIFVSTGAVHVSAQGVTTSAISGTVTGEDGQGLPNLRVVWGRAESQATDCYEVAVAKALAAGLRQDH